MCERLSKYLHENSISQPAFGIKVAEVMGRDKPISKSQVNKWCKGSLLPNKDTMPAVVAATNGYVKVEDFYSILEKPCANKKRRRT